MEINLRSDHWINGQMYPRGIHQIESGDLARALVLADTKATPEGSYMVTLPPNHKDHAEPLPDYIKVPTSGADPDVKKQ